MALAERFRPVTDRILAAALTSVRPDVLLDGIDWTRWCLRPVDAYERIVVVGAGKAAGAMAAAVERHVPVATGAVVVHHGARTRATRTQVFEGGHPIPDAAGVVGATAVLEAAEAAGAGDLVIVVVSGGGSALLPLYRPPVTLDDAAILNDLLLRSGAPIASVNTVRRSLSVLGGGGLAAAAAPAEVLGLVLSDVVGDDPAAIASGPTVPSPTGAPEARAALSAHGLWDAVPDSVRVALHGPDSRLSGTDRVQTRVIGSNDTALRAASREAHRLGLSVERASNPLTGEAREAGRRLASLAGQLPPGSCRLFGGETTVTVKGDGQGGRNQELVLGALAASPDWPEDVVLVSFGTDGRDGPTEAAGAEVTAHVAARARQVGIRPEVYLRRNDAYGFFGSVGGLIVTGPTDTNVMDIQLLVRLHAE